MPVKFPDLENFVTRYNHWIGVFGIVFGTVLSIYFYIASQQAGQVSLSFKTVKIAQAGVPVLKIFDDKGQIITTDVYGLEAVIWNSGDISIGSSSDRVRKPATITLTGSVRILGAVVQDSRNISAADVRLTIDPAEKNVSVHWQQFDPTDAVKIFVIYTGLNQSPIEYSARIIGTHVLSVSEYKETAPNATMLAKLYHGTVYDWENRKLNLILICLILLLQVCIIALVFVLKNRKTVWIPGLMIFSMILMLVQGTSVLAPKIPF